MQQAIHWQRYGNAEYLMSTRVRPKLLADPNRFKTFPVRTRHCDFTDVFMKLSGINERTIRPTHPRVVGHREGRVLP